MLLASVGGFGHNIVCEVRVKVPGAVTFVVIVKMSGTLLVVISVL